MKGDAEVVWSVVRELVSFDLAEDVSIVLVFGWDLGHRVGVGVWFNDFGHVKFVYLGAR